MRENRPYGSEGGEQRYCSPTPIGKKRRAVRGKPGLRPPPERRGSSSSRREAGIQTQERRANAREAWTPASAGATRFVVVPALGRDPDTRAARHAREAWPPASAGATSFVVVPALGRDPDTRAARHARKAWTPASAGATTGTRVAHAMNRFQRWIAPNFFACRVIGQIYSG